jgi:hypothetical protein
VLSASTAAYPTKAVELLDLLQVAICKFLPKQRGISHVQISFDIASSSLDECSGTGAISGNYNLVSNMVSQHVLVLGKNVNGCDVEVQKVGRPRRSIPVYGSSCGLQKFASVSKRSPIDPLMGNERSILKGGKT